MKFSFIIPVYNCRDYLTACVESILASKNDALEIILINDGSTDGSGAVCDELAQLYPQVRVIHQPNGGASAARNRGIREAQGEHILFFDADDTINAKQLGTVLADLRCSEADLTIFGMTFDYYSKGLCYRQDPLFFKHDGILSYCDWQQAFAQLYAQNSLSPVWNKVFRRHILLEHHLKLDTALFLYEDLEFVLRYLAHCETIFNVPQAIYHYRQAEDEGNAKRRLTRIDRLSDLVGIIEAAANGLPGVPADQREAMLVSLFQVLAREKISVSNLNQIGRICDDYAAWYGDRTCCPGNHQFHHHLMTRQTLRLMLRDRKTALRHKIAVWVKSHHLYRRK